MRRTRLIALLALFALVIAACGGTAEESTDTTGGEEPTETTAAPAEEPTETTEAPMVDFEGAVLDAGGCDYGGKINTITAVDQYTVQFDLCSPDPAFLAKAAFTPFGIQPAEHIEATGGAPLENPIGTGPFMLDAWNRGDSIVFKRNDNYYGQVPAFETLVYRWATEGAQRLLELQSGSVDQITNPSPDDFETIQNDPNLQFIPIANPNVFYVGFTNTFAPFDDVKVRQAIAQGIDRQRIIDTFYPAGSEVASHFTPCSIDNGCAGDSWYDFNVDAAKALLEEAGLGGGFSTTIYYRDVFRVYLPEPGLVAQDIQAQLKENLNIDAEVVVLESGEFIDKATSGQLEGIHLLGWSADYPHVTNFLDFHFNENQAQFGNNFPEIYDELKVGAAIADAATAAPNYEAANNAVKELVPMIPIAHGAAASAALATVENANYPPFGAPQFEFSNPGKDTFVYMQNNEPISLYCADETDGESLSPCQQVVEPLYTYATDSGEVVPRLATECVPNDDLTQWICSLREGVTFHDGSAFDANDVVASWSAGLDAANPLHVGNTGSFDYYAYLWDGLINAPESEG
ncbi:MAG: ABC transporter substrate-binding protein [Acidimicrobiia bacterium]|nr:ABC transporter substrate-binding protein [Acidimicrobiia bacterium]MDH4306189.1 ABC transporter substrate-binding protein [Acidimicrobiia bacterium]